MSRGRPCVRSAPGFNAREIHLAFRRSLQGLTFAVPQGVRISPQGARVVPQGAQIARQGVRIVPQGARIAPQGARIAPQGPRIAQRGLPRNASVAHVTH